MLLANVILEMVNVNAFSWSSGIVQAVIDSAPCVLRVWTALFDYLHQMSRFQIHHTLLVRIEPLKPSLAIPCSSNVLPPFLVYRYNGKWLWKGETIRVIRDNTCYLYHSYTRNYILQQYWTI
jgi:hypothetical protein